jgi:HK97 family phage portal protein
MRVSEIVKRGLQVPQPGTSSTYSLARLLGHETYDTDPIKTDSDALKTYSGWVYACVSTISQDVRSSSWKIYQRVGFSKDDWKALDDSQIPHVLRRPSEATTWGDLIELTQIHLDLAGRSFWHLITNQESGGGKVIGIQNLNPDWVSRAIYDKSKTRVVGWELNTAGSNKKILPAEDVVLFRYPDPIEPHGGMSPIRAVAMSHDMDTYSRAYAASHLRNHAQPTGILTTEAELTRDQANVISDNWQDFHQGESRIQVLGKGAQFQTLSAHIRDLEFLNLARVSRDQLLSAFHVPATKLGLVEDSSRANGEEADRVYTSLCLGPRLKRYEEPITHRVLPRLGIDPSQYSFEFDSVDVGDKEFDRIAAETAFKAGAITMDEYRERIGFDPDPSGRGSVYFIPLGSSVVEDPNEASSFVDSVNAPSETSKDSGEEVGEERSLSEDIQEALIKDPSDEAMQIAAFRFLSDQGDAERRLKGRIRAIFSKMQKAIVAEVKRGAKKTQTRAPIKEDIEQILDGFSEEFREVLEKEAFATFGIGFDAFDREAASSALVSADMLVEFETIADEIRQWAATNSAEEITKITEVSKEAVREILSEALDESLSIPQIAARLTKAFDDWKGVRADTIARTETARSYNFGKFTNASKFDQENPEFVTVKTWVPTQDERTREEHRASAIKGPNGESRRSVLQEEHFIVGGMRMMHPLDQRGGAGNVVNCRCVLTFAIGERKNR